MPYEVFPKKASKLPDVNNLDIWIYFKEIILEDFNLTFDSFNALWEKTNTVFHFKALINCKKPMKEQGHGSTFSYFYAP